MSNYAVLHITKYKGLQRIGQHIDRQYFASNVDRDKADYNETLSDILGSNIDVARSYLKEEFSAYRKESLEQAVERRIAEGYKQKRALRKDAVKALGVILTGSHERMKEIEADEELFSKWKKANYDFACQEFGKDNIVRFTLHRDERTPHFHCVFVPITPQGGLSARHYINGAVKLGAYQDRYAALMGQFGLQRGIAQELTQRKHISTKQYYRSVNELAQESYGLVKEIKASNVFKLSKVRQELEERITQLKVEVMERRVQQGYVEITNQTLKDNLQRRVYEQRLVEESKRSYEWIKREIPLAEFAIRRLGWQIDPEKSSRRDAVLKHPKHGRIVVPTRPRPSGHWVYSLVNQKGGGTLIDLLLKQGWSWGEIKALGEGYIAKPVIEMIPRGETLRRGSGMEDALKQGQMAQEQLQSVCNSERRSYLMQRGIDYPTYAGLEGVRADEGRAVFGLYKDVARQPRLCSTISYYFNKQGQSKKYFQKDLPRGLSIVKGKGAIKTIVLTESPIDGLSYRQMKLEALRQEGSEEVLAGKMYVSSCGSLSKGVMEELEALFEQASKEEQKVILALDNDKAGQEMSRRLQEELAAKGCEYEEEFVLGGKDWNEALVQIKQEAREQREGLKVEQKQEEAEEERGEEALKASQHEEVLGTGEEVDVGLGQEEGLKENWEQVVGLLEKEFTYEHSVLDQAQISEEVYKGCVDHMYADEEQVVIGLYQNVGQDKELCSAVHYHWDEQGELHEQVQEARGQGLAVIESEEQAESIVITQSPLEALLLKQQGLEEVQRLEEEIKKEQGKGKEELREELESKKEELARTKYVSYCGVLSEEVQKELKGVLEEAKSEGQKVSFVLEKESMKEVKGLLAEVGYEQQAKEGPRERVGRGLGVGSEVLAGLSALSRIDGGGDEVEEEEEGTKKKRGKGMRI